MSRRSLAYPAAGASVIPYSAGGLWLHDWSAYSSTIDWRSNGLKEVFVDATSWYTFLDISTGPGWLTFARGMATAIATASGPDMRITIDGTAYTFTGTALSQYLLGNMIHQPIKFDSTLKIELYNRLGVQAYLALHYTYLTKDSTPNTSTQTQLGAGSRLLAFQATSLTSLVDVVNVSAAGWLMAILFTGTPAGWTRSSVIIDGTTERDDAFTLEDSSSRSAEHLWLGPVRFATSLRVQHRLNASGGASHCLVWYLLD